MSPTCLKTVISFIFLTRKGRNSLVFSQAPLTPALTSFYAILPLILSTEATALSVLWTPHYRVFANAIPHVWYTVSSSLSQDDFFN